MYLESGLFTSRQKEQGLIFRTLFTSYVCVCVCVCPSVPNAIMDINTTYTDRRLWNSIWTASNRDHIGILCPS